MGKLTTIGISEETRDLFNDTARKSDSSDSFLNKLLILYQRVSPLINKWGWEETLRRIDKWIGKDI